MLRSFYLSYDTLELCKLRSDCYLVVENDSRVRNSKLIEKVIMANGEARELREALEELGYLSFVSQCSYICFSSNFTDQIDPNLKSLSEGFFVKILNLRCQGDYLSGRTTSMLNAKLNGDSPELVLGVVWETHRMFGNSFA
ncbi:hypothetical protein BHM03_00035717 [Ensete ventricosum]|nr:hypothetical protein BHM03_00035717 [Ensete ventricosum]